MKNKNKEENFLYDTKKSEGSQVYFSTKGRRSATAEEWQRTLTDSNFTEDYRQYSINPGKTYQPQFSIGKNGPQKLTKTIKHTLKEASGTICRSTALYYTYMATERKV